VLVDFRTVSADEDRHRVAGPLHSADSLAEQLDGLLELGSREEMARVTRELLAHPQLTLSGLWQAVRAIGMMKSPRRRRSQIEQAYARLPNKACQRLDNASHVEPRLSRNIHRAGA